MIAPAILTSSIRSPIALGEPPEQEASNLTERIGTFFNHGKGGVAHC
jgi:hypothetical protein